MTKVYRVEDPKKGEGLWRNFAGEIKPVFDKLSEGKARELPMPHMPEVYQQEGKHWFASAPSQETLQHWFSKKDLEELSGLGYSIFEMEVKDEKKVSDFEIIFTRDNLVSVRELQISDIYPE